jgi:hypothetical protein
MTRPNDRCGRVSGNSMDYFHVAMYVGVVTTLWLFLFLIVLFAAQTKEFFLIRLKKLEQRSHKCVELGGGKYVE